MIATLTTIGQPQFAGVRPTPRSLANVPSPKGLKRPACGIEATVAPTTIATRPMPAAGIDDRTSVLPRNVTAATTSMLRRRTRQAAANPDADGVENRTAV